LAFLCQLLLTVRGKFGEQRMGTRILVVDDEEDTLSLLRTILQISGFDPITTLNSVEAISLAEVQDPEVILLDVMMPRLDGFTLCKMIRQNNRTTTLPVIFVTAYESLDLEERRVEAGADMIIRKPIDIDVLIKAIETVLAQKKAQPQPTPAALPPAPAVVPTPPAVPPPAAAPTAAPVLGDGTAAQVVPAPSAAAQPPAVAPAAPVTAPATPVSATQEAAPVLQTQEHQTVESKPTTAGEVKP
jgi:CheY-like chemotaxis protein